MNKVEEDKKRIEEGLREACRHTISERMKLPAVLQEQMTHQFKTMVALMEIDAVECEFFNSSATTDPCKPNSQFASLIWHYCGVEYRMVFNLTLQPCLMASGAMARKDVLVERDFAEYCEREEGSTKGERAIGFGPEVK